jgi:hypothetical protein
MTVAKVLVVESADSDHVQVRDTDPMTSSRSGKGKPFNVSISTRKEKGDSQHRLSPLISFGGSAWESNPPTRF